MCNGRWSPLAGRTPLCSGCAALPEAASGAPSAKDGVPTCEADPWCKVFHNTLEVVNAPACVNPRPAFQFPAVEV